MDERTQAWSSYWSEGALHSCVGSFDANYTGAIGAFWDAFIAGIPPGARMLDLATGNGALPLRVWEHHGGAACIRIDAVDLATPSPPWYRAATHPGIAFHPGVAMEALPFDDGSFDRVCSQFGVEYAQRPEALQECLRVAAPDARIAFVLHHAGSVLVSVGREELGNQLLLTAPDGLLATARRVLPWVARARGGEDLAQAGTQPARDRDDYNAALARLARAVTGSAVPDALLEAREWIHRLVAGATPANLSARIDALDAYRGAHLAAMLRTREMVGHALDEAAVADIAAILEGARPGWDVRYEPLVQREGVLAWGLVASASSTSSKGASAAA